MIIFFCRCVPWVTVWRYLGLVADMYDTLLYYLQMRWVSHRESNHIWWMCTWNHPFDSRFRITCSHCLDFTSVRVGSSVTPGCRFPPFGWQPALTRVYCRTCKRVHNPRELTNNRLCDLAPVPYWQKRRQSTRSFYYIF